MKRISLLAVAALVLACGGGSNNNTNTGTDGGGNCPTGRTSCNGVCVDTSSDPTNCGTCGFGCGQGTVCYSGLCLSSCGNGQLQTDEQCDDGNRQNGDGCSSNCQKESGYSCSGTPSVCTTRCGDGVKAPSEGCDDGNTSNGDGCSGTCTVEAGFACAGEPSVCATNCGDGVIVGNEVCDDHNTTAGDGCSPTCTAEPGYSCNGAPSVCQTVCGDGQKAGTETCDDSNSFSGDGCSSSCAIETGYACTGSPSVCAPVCGNGLRNGSEQCDDGNTNNGDGCDSSCNKESGWSCNSAQPSVCTSTCGDGIRVGQEQCDDGNLSNLDGCTASCSVKTGYVCNTATPNVCNTVCGDSIRAGNEGCDDGNPNSGDGCSASCAVETGYSCDLNSPNVCTTSCGDGIKAGSEACDDRNVVNGDGCSSSCAIESGYTCSGSPSVCVTQCGNGVKQGSEQCDDGNTNNGDGCSSACVKETGFNCNTATPTVCTAICGDGLRRGTEACDDFNLNNGDGCSSSCTVESGYSCNTASPSVCGPTCGDGQKLGAEACDDGNTNNGDGCSSTCTLETGFTCSTTVPTTCSPNCGDGLKRGNEACDDFNLVNGDGCSSSCTVEPGYSCTNASPSVCSIRCGDGIKHPSEACDDGNLVNGDCCSSSCTLEPGCEVEPNDTNAQANTFSSIQLGGKVKAFLRNDAGTSTDVDVFKFNLTGAVNTLLVETLDGGSGSSCYNGEIDTQVQLRLPDGGTITDESSGDTYCGLIYERNLPAGTYYVAFSQGTDTTSTNADYSIGASVGVCGNGVIERGEGCDDGNLNNNDGCNATCSWPKEIEPNNNADGGTPMGSALSSPIITGAIQPGTDVDWYTFTVPYVADVSLETFDKLGPNTCNGGIDTVLQLWSPNVILLREDDEGGVDHCSKIDAANYTEARQLQPGTYYVKVYGYLQGAIPEYTLRAKLLTQCGNGIKEGFETCDGTPNCDAFCKRIPVCGDGFVDGTEQCDDGNTVNGDGCTSTCQLDPATPEVEPNNSKTDADSNSVQITGSTFISGAISTVGDVDWFHVTVATAGAVRFETFDSTRANCANISTTMRLYDSAGTEITSDDIDKLGIANCAAISYYLNAGSYYVSVEDGNNSTIASYVLEARFNANGGVETEVNDATSQANVISPSNNVYVFGGHLTNSDTDVWQLNVPAGKSLRAELIEGDTTETCESDGIDSQLELLSSTGAVLVTATDADDSGRGYCSMMDGTGPASVAEHPGANALAGGTYYLRVKAYHSSNTAPANPDGQFNYRLVVTVR
ncbi:MAG: DVUA0089 family protein [Myxococcaceae bacterium]